MKNKEKRKGKFNEEGKASASTLIIVLMERLSLLLLDMLVVVMNGLLTLLRLFIYAYIEIGSPLIIMFKMQVLLGWVMITHIQFLKLDQL